MTAIMRSCSRTGCRWPAAASLSFRYASRQVWLLDLRDPDPALYDLCPHHADALVVPRGWNRVDQRTETPAVREPSAQELSLSPGRVPIPEPRPTVAEHRVPVPEHRAPVPSEHRAPAAPVHPRRPAAPPKPAAPSPAPAVRVNRYEGLHRDLPRLAAEVAELGDLHAEVTPRAGLPAEPGVIVSIDAARRGPQPPLNA
jgi:hypothetical protein